MKLIRKLAGALAALVLSGATQAALFDRGGGMVYDDDLNITWMADWNHARTSGFDPDGLMLWNTAAAWVESLEYGGYSDWRLPSALNADGSGPCTGSLCTGGELAHMYFNELGVTPLSSILTGDPAKLALFNNVQTGSYWTGTDFNGNAVFFSVGGHGYLPKGPFRFFDGLSVVAVRDGDVSPVPEPEAAAMMLLGLGVLMLALRRRNA